MKNIICLILFSFTSTVVLFAQDSWRVICEKPDTVINSKEMVLAGEFIIVSGHINLPNSFKPYVSKYDTDGNLIWSIEVDVPFSGWTTDLKVENDEIYLAGQLFNPLVLDNREPFILKMDMDANLLWSFHQLGENWNFSDNNRFSIEDMHIQNDGSIFFCGTVTQSSAYFGSIHLDPIYGYLNSNQELEWCKTIALQSNTTNGANGIYKKGNNEFLILGRSSAYVIEDSLNYSFDNSDAFIASIDSSGTINYINSYDKIDPNETGNFFIDIIPSEGSYYVLGQINPYLCDEGCTNGIIMKFSNNGTELWTKIIDRAGAEFNDISSFSADGFGGLIIATSHYGFFGIPPFLYSPADAVISNIDDEGDLISSLLLEPGKNDILEGLAIDSENQVYFSGLEEEAVSQYETTKKEQMGRILLGTEICDFIEDQIVINDYSLVVSSQATNSANYISTQLAGPGINTTFFQLSEVCRIPFSYMAIDGQYYYTENCLSVEIDLLENDLFSEDVNVISVTSLNGSTNFNLDNNTFTWDSISIGDEGVFEYVACDIMNVCDTAVIIVSQTVCPLGPPIEYFQDTLSVVPGEPTFIATNCELVHITDSASSIIFSTPAQDGFYIDPPVDFSGVDMFSYTVSHPDTCCPLVCEVHDVFIIGPSSISLFSQDITIYPIPANDLLFVGIASKENYAYRIVDVIGREVLSAKLVSESINVSGLNQGVYFLSLYNSESMFSHKIYIE